MQLQNLIRSNSPSAIALMIIHNTKAGLRRLNEGCDTIYVSGLGTNDEVFISIEYDQA